MEHLNEAEVIRLLRTDEMTGLYKRGYFLERVRDDILRSERYGWPLSVIVLSLTNFEQLQQSHGKIVSDNVLAELAAMVRKFARNTDIACRFDVTSYALLLPGTSRDGGNTIAERLKNRITSHLFSTPDGRPVQATCAIGVGEYREGMAEAQELLSAAMDGLPPDTLDQPAKVAAK